MNVLLLSFSGTGNTTLCGESIKKSFEELGHRCDHYSYRFDQPFDYDCEDYDLIGFGYPIHSFNAPEAFVKFVKKLPKLKEKKRMFLFKVSGEPFRVNGASSHHLLRKLKKRNYELYAEKHFLMPYNIIFRYRDSIAKQMRLYLDPSAKAFVLGMLRDEPERIRYAPWQIAFSFLMRIEWVAPKLNSPFVRASKKKCIDCHKCVQECPCGAIFLNKKGKIRLKASRCTMCMRCAMYCPTDAIHYGFLNPWKVSKPYPYEQLIADKEIPAEFINHETKGYFKRFNKYFDRQKELLQKYGIPNPIEEYRQEND